LRSTWSGPSLSCPQSSNTPQPPKTTPSEMPSDPLDKHKSIDLKLFKPKTRCPFLAVRDREERWPGLV
jgi:hypothetical protein